MISIFIMNIDLYSKYLWVASLKGRKAITITNVFQETLHACGCKPNKIWTDKSIEFYNRSRKYWLQENDIEM